MEVKKKNKWLGLEVNKSTLLKHNTPTKNKTKKASKKISKKNKSLVIIRGIIDYLKSDPYFYSPLLSSHSPSPHSSFPGLEAEEPLLKNEGKLREKVVDYLKSDTYWYAPFGVNISSDQSAVKKVISPQKGRHQQQQQSKQATKEFPWRGTSTQTKKVAEDSTRRKQVPEDFRGEKRGDHISKGTPVDTVVVTPSTPELLEVKRTVIRRSYHTRLSTISGCLRIFP